MINWLLSRVQRPESGWDPIAPAHAQVYAENEWRLLDESLLDRVEQWTGPLKGRRVLDLGGGPGHYSVALALRGAEVTWYDVSKTYEDLARDKAQEHGVANRIRFVVGYLDEAPQRLGESFDLVFNRICWNYSRSDSGFALTLYSLVRPGGCAYIDATISSFRFDELSVLARLRTWMNSALGLKIGHPLPPRGRLAELLVRLPLLRAHVDYSSPWNDRLLIQRAVQ